MKTKFNRLGIIWLFAIQFIAIWAVFANTIFSNNAFQSVWANTGNIAVVSYESERYNDTWYFIFWNTPETGNYTLKLSDDENTLTCHEKLKWYYVNPFWWSGRIWPLHSGTLETLSENDSNFLWLNISGWLFTSCTDEWIDPYAVFWYLEYTYASWSDSSKTENYKIWAWISWLNTENPSFENKLFLIGWWNGSDLSASGWIFDSVSLTGLVTPYSGGNFSEPRPSYLWDQSIGFEFLAPAYQSWDNLWYTTSGTIKIKLSGVTWYHWQLSWDLIQALSWNFATSSFETDVSLTNSTWNKTVEYSVYFEDEFISSTNYQINLIQEEWWNDPTPGTESWSILCTWDWPTPSQISTGGQAEFSISCSGVGEITWNINESSFVISGYNWWHLDIVNRSHANEKTIKFTAWSETWNAQIIFKENIICLTLTNNTDSANTCNESVISNMLQISWSNGSWDSWNWSGNDSWNWSGNDSWNWSGNDSWNWSGNDSWNWSGNDSWNWSGNDSWNWSGNDSWNWSGNDSWNWTETWEIPSIDITQPTIWWSQSKTVKATATNYSWFKYVVTNSTTCTGSTDFLNANDYNGNNIFLDESYNNKYICFKARNSFWTKYAGSNKIENIDSTRPVCTWWDPSKLELHVWETGSITLTCVDTWSKISGSSLSYSDLLSSNQILTLSNPIVWGDSNNRTFSFIYHADAIWNTTIWIWNNKVFDNAWNSNQSASSHVISVVAEDETWHNSASCERLIQFIQTPYSSWTQSNTVEVELFCWSTWRWEFSTTNVWVDVWDGTEFENGHLLLTTTWESFNGQYVCVYAQTWERVETGCTNYPFMVDAFNPNVDLLSPNNWASFESWDSVTLSRSGSDLTSWISWYVLEISKPNGTDIVKQFSENTTSTWIIMDVAWRWYRSVSAYDQAERTGTKTRFFNVTYSGNSNTGNNNGTGNDGSWTVETWFYLISPALFDRISLWTNIRFRWQAWESNSWYEISVEKIWWDLIYSGFTTGTTIVVDSWYFSTWAYSRSVKDISTETTKTISMFYVVNVDNLPDLKVDNFEFDEIRNADINEYYKSNGVIINWLEDWWYSFAYLKNNKWALFINGEFVWTQWFVTNEDRVRIELLSSSWYSTTVSATLIIGSGDNLVSGDFNVTTKDWINGWDDPLLTPFQRLWWMIFVDSLVEMYQNDPAKLATFLSTFMQLLQDKSDYYAQEILDAQADWNEELANEYKTYKNAIDFLYTIVAYRYDHIDVEDRTVYIAPNGKQYLVEYDEERMAYTSPDFARVKYFPTWELFTNHIDMNNPAVWKWWIVGNVITTHNGKIYTIYETNWKWTSSNFKTAKYFDTKEDIINHILANNPASNWNHTVDPDFEQVTYTAPNGKVYKIFKTSSKWNNPNMYSSYNFVDAKYFTSLEAAKKFISQNNKK